jgi:murein DD-endopeptidase MepM/ murein hydrolase activator NlpD
VRGIIVLFLLAVIAAAIFMAWPKMEGDAPVLSGPEKIELSSQSLSIDLAWADEQTGLRSLAAYLHLEPDLGPEIELGTDASKRIELHKKVYPGSSLSGPMRPTSSETITLELDAKEMKIPDGQFTLVLEARDWSWSDGWEGNAAELRIPVVVDTKAPRVSVVSGLTYVRRGGSAIVTYRADGDATNSGVRVGDGRFAGRAAAGDQRIAVFAIPIDAADDPVVEVFAVDAIGNESTARFDVRVQERSFPEISIALSDRFLDRVAVRLGEENEMSEATPLATFQRVNTELRERNESVIGQALDATASAPTQQQWSGAFEQMKNSSVTSDFAEFRHYTYQGQRVSQARHYGFDLASTAGAPITASNAGTVVFAKDNGIYGTLVLIDHGLGISTLYGHLSSLAVGVGDAVTKGQEIGRSGATGLAGGDHLHFAVLVGKTYVDPVEWWDPKWVSEHIDVRLGRDSAAPM